MAQELIRRRLLHPSESVKKAILHYKTITVIPKHLPKKTNEAP